MAQTMKVKKGDTVQINTVVAVIGDGSAKTAEAPKQEAPPAKETPKETPKPKPPAKKKKQ